MGNTRTLVATIGYLLGIDDQHLDVHFDDQKDVIEALKRNDDATCIRYLTQIRATCLTKFGKIGQMIRYDLKNLDTMPEYFDAASFRWLEKRGVRILKAGGRVEEYIATCSDHINNRIGKCQKLFKEWQHFDYIKELFKFPNARSYDGIMAEKKKYQENFLMYPFGRYINWTPSQVGNILSDDLRFMKFLCGLHGEAFTDYSLTRDVGDDEKEAVYQQLRKEPSVWLVDCENCDVFKLAAVFDGMKDELNQTVKKIVLFDDVHSSSAWDRLGAYCHLPIEHIETQRVLQGKSVVDLTLVMYCTKEYYVEGSKNFVLCSSDSDYLSLMNGLPADFLVLYEKDKMSQTALDILETNRINSICIDNFCTSSVEDFQTLVMRDSIKSALSGLETINIRDIIRGALFEARMDASEEALNTMFNRCKRSMTFSINDDGSLALAY